MFNDRMSSQELYQEYQLDMPELQKQSYTKQDSDYVQRKLHKVRKAGRATISCIFKTARGNRYLGVYEFILLGVGKQKQWEWRVFHVALLKIPRGTAVIAFNQHQELGLKIMPHFFERYKERFTTSSMCTDWRLSSRIVHAKTFEDLVTIYISRNKLMAWLETKSEFHNRLHLFAPIPDGVALLQYDKTKKLMQVNTFISANMLSPKQAKMVKFAVDFLSLPTEERMALCKSNPIADDLCY